MLGRSWDRVRGDLGAVWIRWHWSNSNGEYRYLICNVYLQVFIVLCGLPSYCCCDYATPVCVMQ